MGGMMITHSNLPLLFTLDGCFGEGVCVCVCVEVGDYSDNMPSSDHKYNTFIYFICCQFVYIMFIMFHVNGKHLKKYTN